MFARVALFVGSLSLIAPAVVADPVGAQHAAVVGQITLDGQPLANATITMISQADGKAVTGLTDEAGRYAVKLPSGKYRVAISRKRGDVEVIPARYSDKVKTALVAEIARGDNELDFKLTSKGEKPEEAASAKVAGVVTLNGQPLAGATITFHPPDDKSKAAMATTKDDGTYALSFGKKDNVIPATFRITLSKKVDGREVLPPAYADKDKTALMVVVQKGANVHDIQLKSP
jgi:hypothetical protein